MLKKLTKDYHYFDSRNNVFKMSDKILEFL
jgi:hypothetical protein